MREIGAVVEREARGWPRADLVTTVAGNGDGSAAALLVARTRLPSGSSLAHTRSRTARRSAESGRPGGSLMREAEQVEGPGPRISLAPVRRRRPAKLHQPRLLRMKREAVLPGSFGKHFRHAARVHLRRECDDEVVRVADEGCPPDEPGPHLRREPPVEHLVKVDVRSSGETTPPCGVPVSGCVSTPASMTPAFSHLSIARRSTPSRTLWSRKPRRCPWSKESKNPLMSTSSTHPASCPPTVPLTGSPFPPQGPSGRFPCIVGTTESSDVLPPLPPRFVAFAWRYQPRSLVRSRGRGAPRLRGPGALTGRPIRSQLETTGPPRFLANPHALVPRSLTTVRPRRLRLLLGASVLPSAHKTASALTTAFVFGAR